MSVKETVIVEVAKATPPVSVVGAITVLGIGLSDVVLVLTALYTAAMLFFLLRDKWWRQRNDGTKE